MIGFLLAIFSFYSTFFFGGSVLSQSAWALCCKTNPQNKILLHKMHHYLMYSFTTVPWPIFINNFIPQDSSYWRKTIILVVKKYLTNKWISCLVGNTGKKWNTDGIANKSWSQSQESEFPCFPGVSSTPLLQPMRALDSLQGVFFQGALKEGLELQS